MSLILVNSHPERLEVKTWGIVDKRGQQLVDLGGFMAPIIQIPMDDFCALVRYVMSNTDLTKDDPRLALLEEMKLVEKVPGFSKGAKRLAIPEGKEKEDGPTKPHSKN